MYAGTFDGRSLLKRQKAQQAHITKYDATFQVVEALFQFRFHWNFSLCVQVQSKDACMRMKVRAYRACWPLAHVYMKQLKQPVAKVDIISTIDEKRDCCEIIWPNPDIYLIPATRWRHVLGMFPGKLYRHLLSRELGGWICCTPPHQDGIIAPFLIGSDENKSQWKQAFWKMATVE